MPVLVNLVGGRHRGHIVEQVVKDQQTYLLVFGERSLARDSHRTLRNARRDAVESFKKAQKEGMPEDEAKDGETRAQKLLEKYSKMLDALMEAKEKEIMTV